MLRSQAQVMAIAIAQFPKRKFANKDEFCISRRVGSLFFAPQLSKLPRQEMEVVSIEVFTLRISQQFFYSLPRSFTEGFAEFIRLAFEEFTMFFRARLSAVQSLSLKLLGKLLYVDTLTLH